MRCASELKLFTVVMLAGAMTLALTPPAAKARASREPVFSELSRPAATLVTNSPPASAPALNPPSIFPGATNAPAAPSGYVADDKYKLRAGDKISLQILEDRDQP
jgi:hypothetical protein